ncbi:outer membrane protein [Salinarimonas ramus]|uniref:Porin n=1 Tax=Salinarimonas ramus TaxID=690164 RepID=A0A917Q810_9HYPH|nr:outer membrane protein [Salinarimonas ramus]GGK34744.1 porin [Salinarimonas ramus]
MKRLLIASTALVAFTAAAVAADLPVRTEPAPFVPSAPPVFSWTGFYAGVNLGYGWGDFTGATGGVLFDEGDGFVGGGQLGYNVQFGSFVVGLETDLQWTNFEGGPAVPGALAGTVSEAQLDYFGTVRGRAGFALDRTLVFATGGLAYGGADVTAVVAGRTFSDDQTHVGWTLGGGVEHAFTNNLTAKVEYLYTDLDDETYDLDVQREAGLEFSTVRAGVNYKF